MALFAPTPCTFKTMDEETDEFGQPTFGPARPAKCAVVKFLVGREKTSVRADSSGSRGNAEEITADARLLFPPATKILIGDKVTLFDVDLRVLNFTPRLSVAGRLDHYQVDLERWA